MKKMIVLIMALTFALGITSMVFAAEEKKPVAGPGVPAVPPTLSDEEKTQLSDAKRKATTKPKAVKEGTGVPALLSDEEKRQAADAKKKSAAERRKEKKQKAQEAAPAAPVEKAPAEKK
jgi:hypothetical protein